MNRRSFISQSLLGAWGLGTLTAVGCRSEPTAHLMDPSQQDMVGNTATGAETYGPLIDGAVSSLLGRHAGGIQTTGGLPAPPMRICFVGVENASAEELGDFKEQIYELIDTHIDKSNVYDAVSKRFVDAARRETRLTASDLFLPKNMRAFAGVLEQSGQPVDYLLFAKITSGTTRAGKDMQRDYTLTLELVDVNTGRRDKETAKLRKAYHR